jgi:hypothetical protein
MAIEEPFFGFATFKVAPRPTSQKEKSPLRESNKSPIQRFLSNRVFLPTCRDSTAENTNFVERSSRIDLGNTANMNHSVLAKG